MTQTDANAGSALFARYAYPPNELGYCGPPDAGAAAAAHAASVPDVGASAWARGFDGAWPYLEAIASAIGAADPLRSDVVDAYWVGGSLLRAVDSEGLLRALRRAFAHQAGTLLGDVDEALAHHSFHVCAAYPWARLLEKGPVALSVLQNCRIRWGTVVAVDSSSATVVSRPLEFRGVLTLGPPAEERVRWRTEHHQLAVPPRSGDVFSIHWDWMCERLSTAQVESLHACTEQTLRIVNRVLAR
ncbi:DUF6390 family protein [Hoyosella sp. YIM 151337]|uniref:DUF6390 family protein n=1 Tax=Hoyosella sp. YIM 151337 TaxID=2992742 RepID=UPI0022355380|nr:DUF6390 family protein [Hoyosella sp. YIM 151337]MCW4353091.1 DUF6390 family protein [Hoyosella sp. YIM 151337]